MNSIKKLRELFVGFTISSAIILLTLPGIDSAYNQSMLMSTTSNSTTNNMQTYTR